RLPPRGWRRGLDGPRARDSWFRNLRRLVLPGQAPPGGVGILVLHCPNVSSGQDDSQIQRQAIENLDDEPINLRDEELVLVRGAGAREHSVARLPRDRHDNDALLYVFGG